MKRFLFLLLLMASLAFSRNITIVPFEYKDLGNISLPAMNSSISMDCSGKTISARTTYDGSPVPGVFTMLKYVQYDNPLISSGNTDSSGYIVHRLNGNISFMTGIFILVMEKSGFRNREAHFYIDDCFGPQPEPPPQPPQDINQTQNATPPTQNITQPEQNVTPPSPPPISPQNVSPIVPRPNYSQNNSNQTSADGGKQTIPFCPISLGIALLPFAAAAQRRR